MKYPSLPLLAVVLSAVFLLGMSCSEASAETVPSGDCSDHDHALEVPEDDDDHDAHEDLHANEDDHGDSGVDVDVHDESTHSETVIELTERDIADAGIEVSVAGGGEIRQSATHYGEITINRERLAHLSPPVAGVVRTVNARLGDDVQQGELIAVIASRELADARTAYINARAGIQLAEEVFQSQQQLFQEGFLSEQGFLAERQAYTTAQAEFNSARQTLSALGVSDYQLNTLSSSGELNRYEVRSPISGTVIEMHITPGENIMPGGDLAAVADLSRVWVSLNVPQNALGGVHSGQEMTVSHSRSDIPSAVTSVDYVASVFDGETRAAVVRGELDNTHGLWRPGLFVSAEVSSGVLDEPVVVYSDAVQFVQGENVVFIPEGHGFASVPVTLGASDGEFVGITSGLHPGDRYVSHGAFSLKAEIVTSGLDSHAGHGH